MPFTLATLATILVYTWVFQPRGVPVSAAGTIVVVLAAWSSLRSGVWGLSLRAFIPCLRAAALFTIPAVIVVLAAGWALGTLHVQDSLLPNFAVLVAWGGAQQWVLQTVVLREVQRLTSGRKSIALAAFLFALVHLPNPLLTLMTFVGALGWCTIFTRYPNLVPLALSHAAATLALLSAFDDRVTGRLRTGYAYLELLQN